MSDNTQSILFILIIAIGLVSCQVSSDWKNVEYKKIEAAQEPLRD